MPKKPPLSGQSPPRHRHLVTCGFSAEGASLDSGSHPGGSSSGKGVKERQHTHSVGFECTLGFIRPLCGGLQSWGTLHQQGRWGDSLRLGRGEQVALL